jgi:hypothetical protein
MERSKMNDPFIRFKRWQEHFRPEITMYDCCIRRAPAQSEDILGSQGATPRDNPPSSKRKIRTEGNPTLMLGR